ncbi:hypothetical protein [Nocardia sp. CA-135398]|uniref:hypothetical protein n=1 Tax=Nocardia sp. CA-135398 TaxID=3239977 RepID=UPI003D97E2E4
MELRPGMRLNSAMSSAEVIVVRAPSGDVDIRCGGRPMVVGAPPAETGPPSGDPLLLGKRYCDEDGTVELLCTKPGLGALSLGGVPLTVKVAKPLPASD